LVICPGVNDGDVLDRSIDDLLERYPRVQSVAAVPVGLTRIRTERAMSRGMPLRQFRADEADRVLDQVESARRRAFARFGEPVVYAADELYLVAGRDVPPAADYADWAQLENGVGLVRQLLDDWEWLRQRLPTALPRPRHLTMACGTLIAPALERIVSQMSAVGNLKCDLQVVANRLFGDEVTCSGLLVGRDLIAALEGADLGDTVVLPRDMFDHSGRITLDDMTVDDIGTALKRPVVTARCLSALDVMLVDGQPKPIAGDAR
jgi:putative radical SAM enzyme (TIGR03279 family)